MATQKGLGSAGTKDKAVERIEEGLDSTVSGNAQTRATFDAGKAAGRRREKPTANIDTSGTSYDASDGALNIKRGEPGVW